MFTVVFVAHILLCVALIGFVLIQQGKGADAGATFGGSNANSVLGTGGADFATKMTTGLAVAFMITSIMLVRTYPTAGNASILPTEEVDPLEGTILDVPEAVETDSSAEEASAAAEETSGEAGAEAKALDSEGSNEGAEEGAEPAQGEEAAVEESAEAEPAPIEAEKAE